MDINSIKFKLTATIFIIGLVICTVFIIVVPPKTRAAAEDVMRTDVGFIVDLLRENVSIGMQMVIFDDGEALNAALNNLLSDSNETTEKIRSVAVYDTDMEFLSGLNWKREDALDFSESDSFVVRETKKDLIVFSKVYDKYDNHYGYLRLDFSKDDLNSTVRAMSIFIWVVAFVFLAIITSVGYFSIKYIMKPLHTLTLGAQILATGDIDVNGINREELNEIAGKKDEFGDIGKAFTSLIDYLRNLSDIATNIGKGKLDIHITPVSEKDQLTISMEHMRTSLVKTVEDVNFFATSLKLINKASSSGMWDMKAPENAKKINMKTEVWYSDQFRKMLGYNNVKDFPGNLGAWIEKIHDSDRDKVLIAFVDHVKKNTPFEQKYRIKHKNGDLLWFESKASTSRDERGNAIVVGGMHTNISDEIIKIELENEAKSIRNYQSNEIRKLAENLNKLASGDLNFKPHVDDATEITKDIHDNFVLINNNLELVQYEVKKLIDGTEEIVNGALEGKLDVRGDITQYNGDFKKVIEGVNRTLDVVIAPIEEVLAVMGSTANKDLTERVKGSYKGEFLRLKDNINTAVSNLQKAIFAVSGTTNEMNSTSDMLKSISTQLVDGSTEVTAQSSNVASSAVEVSVNVDEVTKSTSRMSEGVTNIAASSEEMASNVNTVASAIEELTSSLQEVARNTLRGSDIASNAVSNATEATTIMRKLSTAANEITKVVDVITDIADQTNLLALNATIEAASAGEAGKGFAVVANEVKELAKQTAQATNEITSEIQNMQNSTGLAVSSIEEIARVIDELGSITHIIATSVEEQTSTTNEISRSIAGAAAGADEVSKNVSDLNIRIQNEVLKSVKEAAIGINEVSNNINGISNVTEQMSSEAVTTNETSSQVAVLANKLKMAVGEFKI